MDACRECCVLSGRGLCDELITRPEESYRLWRVVVCYLEKITLVNEDEGQDPLRGYYVNREREKKLRNEHLHDLQSSNVMTVVWFVALGNDGGSLPSRESFKGKTQLGRSRLGWENDIKMHLTTDGVVGSGFI
jgi:hypothetical protein